MKCILNTLAVTIIVSLLCAVGHLNVAQAATDYKCYQHPSARILEFQFEDTPVLSVLNYRLYYPSKSERYELYSVPKAKKTAEGKLTLGGGERIDDTDRQLFFAKDPSLVRWVVSDDPGQKSSRELTQANLNLEYYTRFQLRPTSYGRELDLKMVNFYIPSKADASKSFSAWLVEYKEFRGVTKNSANFFKLTCRSY